LSNNKLFRN